MEYTEKDFDKINDLTEIAKDPQKTKEYLHQLKQEAANGASLERQKEIYGEIMSLVALTLISARDTQKEKETEIKKSQPGYEEIKVGDYTYQICKHLKEIKYELSDVAHILGGVYNKKQLFNWMSNHAEDYGEDWDYSVSGEDDGYGNCWAIWCKDITGKSENEIEEIIDDGHPVCFVRDDNGKLWYFGCDID